MRSPAAKILETALALQHAPGERFRLRERPLPPGLVHVLEVASGAPQALSAAAAELGESERVVLDAARFYLQQILFAAPDADAYRILGVDPAAPDEDLRTHRRWLQRWLHPDRAQAGDAAVFATRVNQAWAHVRTPELRHAYNVRLAEARMAGAAAPLPASTVRHWQHGPYVSRSGHRSRWLFVAAVAVCGVLAVLILRHQERVEPWEQAAPEIAAATAPGPVDTTVPESDVDVLGAALAAPMAVAEIPTPPQAPSPIQARPEPVVETNHAPVLQARTTTSAPSIREVAMPVRQPEPQHALEAHTPPESGRTRPTEVANRAAAVAPVPAPSALPPTVAGAAPKADPALLVERLRQAEQRVAQLAAYLSSEPGAVPLWNDVQTQTVANTVRDRLAVRQGTRLELIAPSWKLHTDNATINVGYRCTRCNVRQGTLDVELVWREGFWLVRGIELAPSA